MSRKLPIEFVPEAVPAAMKSARAARYLGIGTTKLWLLTNLPKTDPRRIRQTSYGTYAKVELDRHLKVEMERAA